MPQNLPGRSLVPRDPPERGDHDDLHGIGRRAHRAAERAQGDTRRQGRLTEELRRDDRDGVQEAKGIGGEGGAEISAWRWRHEPLDDNGSATRESSARAHEAAGP